MPHIKNAQIRFRIIDRALRNKYRPFPSKKDLREACEEALYGNADGDNICDSTIEKDLFAMRMDHDAPIKYSKIEKGYYYEDPDFSINDIPLTEEDLTAIRFAVKTLSQFRESEMFRQFGSAIDKISDRISVKDVETDDINRFIQFETALSTQGNEYLQELLGAIQNGFVTKFRYASFQSGKEKARRVIPLFLKEYRNRWYLISYDLNRETIITYALERLKELEVTTEKRQSPVVFDPDSFFRYSTGITAGNAQPQLIRFKADNVAAKYIESQPFHQSQHRIKSGKNRSVFELKVIVSEEFIRSLMSYGGEIEILEPESLRQEILTRTVNLLNTYQ